jgi:hypothetical protein
MPRVPHSSKFSSLEITELVVFALNVRQVADHVVRVLSRTELQDLGTVATKTERSQHSVSVCLLVLEMQRSGAESYKSH